MEERAMNKLFLHLTLHALHRRPPRNERISLLRICTKHLLFDI